MLSDLEARRQPGRGSGVADCVPGQAQHLTCTQLTYLGFNAHVNNDLAFMIEDMGARYL